MTLRYRSSTSSLRDTAAKQPEPSSTGETAVRAGKSKERNTAARHHKIARASYRLQDVDIDNWLKESMPIPPDWEYEALPPPPPGSAAAMFGDDGRKHQQGYAFYHHPREEVDHIAPLNPRPAAAATKHRRSMSVGHEDDIARPRTFVPAVPQMRVSDHYHHHQANDSASSSNYYSRPPSEVVNWPLVST